MATFTWFRTIEGTIEIPDDQLDELAEKLSQMPWFDIENQLQEEPHNSVARYLVTQMKIEGKTIAKIGETQVHEGFNGLGVVGVKFEHDYDDLTIYKWAQEDHGVLFQNREGSDEENTRS